MVTLLGLILVILLPVSAYFYLAFLADKFIYFKYGAERWAMQRPGICSKSRKSEVFADMRPGSQGQPLHPLELSCEQSRLLPAKSQWVTAADGLKVHYRLFAPTGKAQPILLYVPGITSAWLDGARYAPLARRLGFQLAVMEIRNHGLSGNNGKGAAYGCRENADVLAVSQDLARRFPGRPMLLWGTSMGSMALFNAAADLEATVPAVEALILENPPSSLREVVEHYAKQYYPNWLYESVITLASVRSGVDYRACAPTALGRKINLPALVTVTRHDTMTPVPMVKKAFASLPEQRGHQFRLYPHGKHGAIWNGQPEVYEKDILAFWQTRKGKRPVQAAARPKATL